MQERRRQPRWRSATRAIIAGDCGHSLLADGNDADPDRAASMIDRVLASTCTDDPAEHHTAPEVTAGRPLVTSYGCGVKWYGDFSERLAHVASYAGGWEGF